MLKRRAQAMTELVVLGSLIIVVFAFLIKYSEELNRKQSYIMQAFRSAMQQARGVNGSASYGRAVFRRMPNVESPYEIGKQANFSENAAVFWSNGEGNATSALRQINKAYSFVLTAHSCFNGIRTGDATLGDVRDNLQLALDYLNGGNGVTEGAVDYATAARDEISARQPLNQAALALWNDEIINRFLMQCRGALEEAISNINEASLSSAENTLNSTAEVMPEAAAKSATISLFQLNEDSPVFVSEDTRSPSSIDHSLTDTDTFTDTLNSAVILSKIEAPSAGISTRKALSTTDTLKAEMTIGGQSKTFTHYLGADGKYYPLPQQAVQRAKDLQ